MPSLSLPFLLWNLIISTLKWRNYDLFHSLPRIPSIRSDPDRFMLGDSVCVVQPLSVLARGKCLRIEQPYPYYRKIWNYGTRNAELFIYLSFDVARLGAPGENCNRALIFPSSLSPSSLSPSGALRARCIKRE